MTPCEEVKTIHASQNDNATRKWAFDLYDENGKIDSSSIKEQMIFDSRVGGTEQILPVNGSEPTTSPIIADIQYPDSLRSEQTFLYRESPTTVNGQAKITHIKGNTLVWNQQIKNGNFSDASNWMVNGTTLSVSNNVATFVVDADYDCIYQTFKGDNTHKYYASVIASTTNASKSWPICWYRGGWQRIYFDGTSKKRYSVIFQTVNGDTQLRIGMAANNDGATITAENVILIDLTQMFGTGNEPTSVDQFTSLYPLSYYAYTKGKLLPFKGESLKTTGKNLFNKNTDVLNAWINTATQTLASGSNYRTAVLRIMPSTTYTISKTAGKAFRYALFSEYPVLETTKYNSTNANHTASSITFTSGANDNYLAVLFWSSGNGDVLTPEEMASSVMVEVGSSASSYEPYTSSTINLPTLTYFPTGMKDVPDYTNGGKIYDEMTESKAIPRVGSVDLGTLDWSSPTGTNQGHYRMRGYGLGDIIKKPSTSDIKANIRCAIYDTVTAGNTYREVTGVSISINGEVIIYDPNYNTSTSGSAFATHVSGFYLYYELATPTEESITTASLVTEKGEAPLYYDDELIADCNETISSESGIFDAKIKLMDDETIYSQKIQLHVERKP